MLQKRYPIGAIACGLTGGDGSQPALATASRNLTESAQREVDEGNAEPDRDAEVTGQPHQLGAPGRPIAGWDATEARVVQTFAQREVTMLATSKAAPPAQVHRHIDERHEQDEDE